MLGQSVPLPKRVWVPEDRPTITEHLHFVSKHSWDAKNVLPPHRHTSFEFIFIVNGRGVIVVDGAEFFLRPGDVLVVEPSSEHAGMADPNSPFRLLTLGYEFNPNDITTDPRLLGMDNAFLRYFQNYSYSTSSPIIHDRYSVSGVIRKMIGEVLDNKAFDKQLLTAHLIEFFVLMIRNMGSSLALKSSPDATNESILAAQAYIRSKYSTPLTLQDIAGEVCLSPSHFCRLFKKATDMTPKDYLNSVRIEKAKSLLKYSNITLTEIAERVGYSGIHYFSRCFKKKEGISPLEYRRSFMMPDPTDDYSDIATEQ